jgi:hypothetical protein
MRIHVSTRHLLLVIALGGPALLRAQFQPPTSEELKMTDDPKAPGAAAVYLDREEVTNDELHFHSFYARIKVLQEKGKELATVNVSYQQTAVEYGESASKVTDIKARTIHPDGTIIPLTIKPEDLLVAKSGDVRINQKVFTLPSVEVGSILEYRYEVRYNDDYVSSPQWEIQQPYFVHNAHYAFTPFKGFLPGHQNQTRSFVQDAHGHISNLIWWSVLPTGSQIKYDVAGRYSVDLTDIPPIPREQWMPPLQSFLYKVLFYYSGAQGAPDFWVDEARR